MVKIGKEKALFIAKKLHVEFVFNMAQYEGNPFTYPEVQTTLDGVTVGGRKISDQSQILRISDGWHEIRREVEAGTFCVTKDTFIHINSLVANNEALSVGGFRDGNVSISGTDYQPPEAGYELLAAYKKTEQNYYCESDEYKQGFGLFLDAARAQFFWDGNKRTAQLMMNGHFLSYGYAPVSLRPDVLLPYNKKMIAFYESGQKIDMFDFLAEQQKRVASNFVDKAKNKGEF